MGGFAVGAGPESQWIGGPGCLKYAGSRARRMCVTSPTSSELGLGQGRRCSRTLSPPTKALRAQDDRPEETRI